MITLREAFIKADYHKLRKEIASFYDGGNKDINVDATLSYIKHLLTLKGKKNTRRFVFFNYRDVDGVINTSCVPLSKIKHKYKYCAYGHKALSRLFDKALEHVFDCYVTDDNHVDTYAYEYTNPNELINYYLPNCTIKELGLETVLAVILYEMTFFGFDRKSVIKARKELEKSVNEVEQLSKEENEEFIGKATKVRLTKEEIRESKINLIQIVSAQNKMFNKIFDEMVIEMN